MLATTLGPVVAAVPRRVSGPPVARPGAPTGRHAGRRGRLRLTRRGRALIVLVAAVLLLGVFSLGRAATSVGSAPPRAHRQTVVAPGDTLWSIARRVAPHTDPRDTVAALERLNRLPGGTLQAGQSLRLPAR